MDDALSPTSEPYVTLEEAHSLTGLSIKTLRDSYCRKGKLPGARLGKRTPRDPKPLWLIPQRSLESEGLMPQPSASQLAELPLQSLERTDLAGALLARADAFLALQDRFLTEGQASAREAGAASVWQQVAQDERRKVEELTVRVGILEAQVQTLTADRDRLAADLDHERTRTVRFGEWFWGKRGERP